MGTYHGSQAFKREHPPSGAKFPFSSGTAVQLVQLEVLLLLRQLELLKLSHARSVSAPVSLSSNTDSSSFLSPSAVEADMHSLFYLQIV
jgi:hypothetical protein